MQAPSADLPSPTESGIDARILAAAFAAFTEVGYAAASTLDIARRARVSKRDLYARFGNKQAMLVACIKNRTSRMGLTPTLPAPDTREQLATILTRFASGVVRQVSDPTVVAAFRLAIAEAARAPEIAHTLDLVGRGATRSSLAALFENVQARDLLAPADPLELAAQYLGLLWEGLMVGLLLGVDATPTPAEAERRAAQATAAFLQLHPPPPAAG